MHKLLRLFLLGISIILLLSGCQRRYWFRIKLPGEYKRKYATQIDIVNYSPEVLSKNFEEVMLAACKKQLKKSGYIVSAKDSPVFRFQLTLQVDTFSIGEKNYQKSPMPSKNVGKGFYFFNLRRNVKAIIFECKFYPYKNSVPNWTTVQDNYFFNEEERDLGRSVGTVRYLIRYGNRNWEAR